MYRRRKFIFNLIATLAVFAGVGQSFAQTAELNELKQGFEKYKSTVLQEKIYLHTDREFYVAGEYMWFKVYAVDASLHRPLDVSHVCYVEVLDRANTVVAQAKVALDHGTGSGSLFLPATVDTDNFTVRAYTRWMKNFDPAFYFHKTITLVNTFRSLPEKAAASRPKIAASFFPEGGYLVAGLRSKVGVEVKDENNTGISFHGAITNQHSDTVARFSSLKFGLGHFAFTPQPDIAYTAIIQADGGIVEKFSLPEVKANGYVLQLADSLDELMVFVKSKNVSGNVYLLAHTREVTRAAVVQQLVNGETLFRIKKQLLGDGISHLTLFDHNRQPVCERLYFKRPESALMLDLNADQEEYGIRRKVTLGLSTANEAPVVASVAVYELDSLTSSITLDINTSLLLLSDLGAGIESPTYYLNSSDAEATAATDNLMLTHGWRRFSWDSIRTQPAFTFVPEKVGHILEGKITDATNTPVSGALVIMSTPGKDIQPQVGRSHDGRIFFETNNLWGNRKVVVQTYPVDSTFKITLNDPFSQRFANIVIPQLSINTTVQQSLLDRSVAMQVQDVYHEHDINQYGASPYDSTAFYGKAEFTYYLDDYTRFPVMEEVMREYVPNVWVRKRKNEFHFKIQDNERKIVYEDNPLVLVDGIPVKDINSVVAFDPRKVQKLEVMARRYYLGERMFPGVVSYTTYNGDLAGFNIPASSLVVDYAGLQRQRKFYAPQYASQQARDDRNPDRRTLLYWNGDITLSSGIQEQLEFFTSDLSGRFIIVVEGLSTDGTAGHVTQGFKVVRR